MSVCVRVCVCVCSFIGVSLIQNKGSKGSKTCRLKKGNGNNETEKGGKGNKETELNQRK